MNNGKEFLKLVQENPDLPIVPMVDREVCLDDTWGDWFGSFGECWVDSYVYVEYCGNNRFFTKDEQDRIEEYLVQQIINEDVKEELSYEEIEKQAHEKAEVLPWKKAIIVYIRLPEVDE